MNKQRNRERERDDIVCGHSLLHLQTETKDEDELYHTSFRCVIHRFLIHPQVSRRKERNNVRIEYQVDLFPMCQKCFTNLKIK